MGINEIRRQIFEQFTGTVESWNELKKSLDGKDDRALEQVLLQVTRAQTSRMGNKLELIKSHGFKDEPRTWTALDHCLGTAFWTLEQVNYSTAIHSYELLWSSTKSHSPKRRIKKLPNANAASKNSVCSPR